MRRLLISNQRRIGIIEQLYQPIPDLEKSIRRLAQPVGKWIHGIAPLKGWESPGGGWNPVAQRAWYC